MSLKLITNQEKLKLEFHGATFYYRRTLPLDYKAIVDKHTVRGKLDFDAAMKETLEKYVIGWEGVVDDDGNEVEFKPDLLWQLPDVVHVALFTAIRGVGDGKATIEELEKNLSGEQR
ncbi:MAG: hypothetical protein GXO75_15415 [Calditrichaeota bacterium]|nr:hypothetical protein [Calditrichota bacterium]